MGTEYESVALLGRKLESDITMWKYISSAAILSLSVVFLPSAVGNPSLPVNADRPSFDEQYIVPELAKLKTCQNAKLPIYFRDNLIAEDTREHFTEVSKRLSNCAGYKILVLGTIDDEGRAERSDPSMLSSAVSELSKHGLNARISQNTQSTSPNLILNGLGAYVTVEFD